MPSSKMNFAEAVDYAALLERGGVPMGLAVSMTVKKTGYSSRELAQACAERSNARQRARKQRQQQVPISGIGKFSDTEAYRRASRGS